MTPTRLQQIRNEYAEDEIALASEGDMWSGQEHAQHANIGILLTLWDTHQTALRALVEQWKQEAKATDKAWSPEYAFELCADQLERLLTPEQS